MFNEVTDDKHVLILFTTEKIFPIQVTNNDQDDKVYGKSIVDVSIGQLEVIRRQKPASSMVLAGVTDE